MSEATILDIIDEITLYPGANPEINHSDQIEPMAISPITLPSPLPHDPLKTFLLYFTNEVLDSIVRYTNNIIWRPARPNETYTRDRSWYPTIREEIYVYIAIRIYMALYHSPDIASCWDGPEDGWKPSFSGPFHPFTIYMSKDRFQELHIRYQFWNRALQNVFERINRESNITVDQYIIRCFRQANIHTNYDRQDCLLFGRPLPLGLGTVEKGAWQAIEHVLGSSYSIYVKSTKDNPDIKTLTRNDFKTAIYTELIELGAKSSRYKGFRGMHSNPIPPDKHHLVLTRKKGECHSCKGKLYGGKRLGPDSGNSRSKPVRRSTVMGCLECDIPLCKRRECFIQYHKQRK